MNPRITQIDCIEFEYELEHVAIGPEGFNLVYAPGETYSRTALALKVITSSGETGEFVGGNSISLAQIKAVAPYLIGKNPLHREKHWQSLRRGLRQYDGVGIGPLDIALWDYAGKQHGAAIHELLGTYRTRLPAYASTYFAHEESGFTDPESYADFAEQSYNWGFQAFKTHTWCGTETPDIDREIKVVNEVANRVGSSMTLMHDPVCEYKTFGDALRVGQACDEQDYFWYEDPYANGGQSQHGFERLRERIETPLLQTELVRGLEPHVDFMVSGATDYCRADVEWDGGITGAMKIARAAEGLGIDVEYHLANPATRHCMAATRNSNYYELGLIHPQSTRPHTQPPVYKGGYSDDPHDVSEDGTYGVPDGPGLGVTYDWEYITQNVVRQCSYS